MTREILFRGKRTDNNEWIYGNLITMTDNVSYGDSKVFSNTHIIENEKMDMRSFLSGCEVLIDNGITQIHKDTVGQYTGIKDRNNIRIFEGDIIKDVHTDEIYTVFYVAGGFVIESNPKAFGYGLQNETNPTEPLSDMQLRGYVEDSCNVIGNIYDNKDMLKLI